MVKCAELLLVREGCATRLPLCVFLRCFFLYRVRSMLETGRPGVGQAATGSAPEKAFLPSGAARKTSPGESPFPEKATHLQSFGATRFSSPAALPKRTNASCSASTDSVAKQSGNEMLCSLHQKRFIDSTAVPPALRPQTANKFTSRSCAPRETGSSRRM